MSFKQHFQSIAVQASSAAEAYSAVLIERLHYLSLLN